MTEVPLKCKCGQVRGMASHISPKSGIRVVCYCDDCQAFAKFLGHEDEILDQYGGTDIFQINPTQITFAEGGDQIRCMRLTSKGIYRWYTACCNTPIGNTASSKIPFVGMIHSIMDDAGKRDQNLGPVFSYVQGKYAIGALPKEKSNEGFPFSLMLKAMFKVFVWKITGKQNPSPFFEQDGKPVSVPEILSSK